MSAGQKEVYEATYSNIKRKKGHASDPASELSHLSRQGFFYTLETAFPRFGRGPVKAPLLLHFCGKCLGSFVFASALTLIRALAGKIVRRWGRRGRRQRDRFRRGNKGAKNAPTGQ